MFMEEVCYRSTRSNIHWH